MVLSHCYEAEVVVVAAAVDDDGPTSPHAVASYDLFPLWRAYHLEIGLPDGLSAVEQIDAVDNEAGRQHETQLPLDAG